MARAKVNRNLDAERAQQIISMAAGAAEALVTGVRRVAERVIAEAARARETGGDRTDPAPRVATSDDRRASKAIAKARERRSRRRGVA